MAPIATELATLRALTFRISSTPTQQLPQHVPAIVASLPSCKTLLSSSQGSGKQANSSETSVAIHKYRTLLSTLLQDRTIQGRWCAIVLIKASVEIGGWETLQKSLPWVRGLLGFLAKPDPPSSKRLCIIALTRIFLLTREYPTLVREITTPSLPAFVQSTLQLANSKVPAALLQTILQSYNELLPRHPTIFRSYLKQLQPLLARLIAPTPSTKFEEGQDTNTAKSCNTEVSIVAKRLHAQLAHCAPKGASSEDWQKFFKNTIEGSHQTADLVFRAVVEETQFTARSASAPSSQNMNDEVQDTENPIMGLTPWTGIFAGSERLIGLLGLLKQYVGMPTSNQVYLNVGIIMDLITRLLSLTVPIPGGKGFQDTVRINTQVSKEERENLWLVLPNIHVATIELLMVLISRSSKSTLALDPIIVDQLTWLFKCEKDTPSIRTACYLCVKDLLQRSGSSFSKSAVDSLVPIIRACCDDLLPTPSSEVPVKPNTGSSKANGSRQPQMSANADAILSSKKHHENANAGLIGLTNAAQNLLPVLLSDFKAQYLSDAMRARLDRTAILTQDKEALVSSVLNPPPSKKFGKPAASILPLMARLYSDQKDVEGMLRPRMPVIRLGTQDPDDVEDVEDEEMLEDDIADEDEEMVMPEQLSDSQTEVEGDHFVGQELDSLLQEASAAEKPLEAPTANHKISDAAASSSEVPSIIESAASVEASKRTMKDDLPSGANKRVKFDEPALKAAESVKTETILPVHAQQAPGASTVVSTSSFTATSTASVVPDLPQPGGPVPEDEDSDMDDVVPLVLGQDTDDESD